MYFDDETAAQADGEQLRVHVSGAWNISGVPNGGYLSAIALRAMRDVAAHADPLTFTTHFFRPGLSELEAVVETDLIRSGRTTSATTATLTQDGKERLRSMAVFGELTGSEVAAGPHLDLPAPEVPPPDECIRRDGGSQGVDLAIVDRIDVRLDPDHAPPVDADGPWRRRAEMLGWVRFVDERPVDTLALPLFTDVFPPPLLNLLGPVGWVPTIELTVHVRRRPVPGWVLARFEVVDLADGRLVENGVLWDESGSVVAQSRQLGLLRETPGVRSPQG